MKKRTGLAAALLAFASIPAVAQEHWTEGPVWECTTYRTNPGMFDAYMKYIRAHAARRPNILDFMDVPRYCLF